MCLMIAAGQTLFSCMSGTAFAKYSFPLKKFWFILFALFMILPIQVTLLPNYILLEKLKHLAEQKSEEFASLLQSMIRNEGDYDGGKNSSKDLS